MSDFQQGTPRKNAQNATRTEKRELTEPIQTEELPVEMWALPMPLMRTEQSLAVVICESEQSNAGERKQFAMPKPPPQDAQRDRQFIESNSISARTVDFQCSEPVDDTT
jgi:hypothetical protein